MSKMYRLFLEEKRHWLEVAGGLDPGEPGGDAVKAFLPAPVSRYLEMAGFGARPLPKAGEIIWKESLIKFGPEKPWTKLKTLQFNLTPVPVRMAYMATRMSGLVPFEGRDLYAGGQGHMLGKIAGLIPVFDDRSGEIARSGVVTVLGEIFLVPGYLTEPYITWEAISELAAKARLTDQGLTGEGIFNFNERGEVVSFFSEDRFYANPKGGNERRRWTAYCENYIEKNGIRFPSKVRAVWSLPEGDFEYWNGTIDRIEYAVNV